MRKLPRLLLLLSIAAAGTRPQPVAAQSPPATAQPSVTAQPPVTTQLPMGAQPLSSSAIDSLVERTLRTFEVPGIAVCVIKDGKIIHSKGYGLRSLNTRQPVDENTLFGIASNSKAFTTAALGMLVAKGKLNWDDKVRKYIPEFTLFDHWVTEEFTIRDLLCHRNGTGTGGRQAGVLPRFPAISRSPISCTICNSSNP